jgi:hypothetical protein
MRSALTARRAALFAALFAAGLVLAQDYQPRLRERNVVTTEAHLVFLDDGGCDLAAIGVGTYDARADGGALRLVVQTPNYPHNGARCVEDRAAALAAVKLELNVGDGGRP